MVNNILQRHLIEVSKAYVIILDPLGHCINYPQERFGKKGLTSFARIPSTQTQLTGDTVEFTETI